MLRPPLSSVPSFLACHACRRATLTAIRPAILPPISAVAGPSRGFLVTPPLHARSRQRTKILEKRRAKVAIKAARKPSFEERAKTSQLYKSQHERELQLEMLAKEEAIEALTRDLPEYTEEYLEEVYSALLSSADEKIEEHERLLLQPPPDEAKRLDIMRGADVVKKLYQRLLKAASSEGDGKGLTELSSRTDLFPARIPRVGEVPLSPEDEAAILHSGETSVRKQLKTSYPVALQRIRSLVSQAIGSDTGYIPRGSRPSPIRLAVATKEEWTVLLAASVWFNDKESVKEVFQLMRYSGQIVTDALRAEVVDFFAMQGRIPEVHDLLVNFNKTLELESKLPQDFLIKAFARAGQLAEAISQLHNLEDANIPASIQTYSTVTEGLLNRKGVGAARDRALAWDLFAHMRFVAHPTPDAHLYSLMIRACAEGPETQPERATDLFTEMTVDNALPATTEAYNALILTLARAKRTAREAFRLLQEMIQKYRDDPSCGLRPDRMTYLALFESAKRLGDLPRARWILAELLKAAQDGGVLPDEQMLSSVFQTYAAYRVPYIRRKIKLAPEPSEESVPAEGKEADPDAPVFKGPPKLVDRHEFTPAVPQSHGEVIREVEALLSRVLEDSSGTKSDGGQKDERIFREVVVSTRLWNSYQSVHWAHSSLETAMAQYHRQTQHRMEPNARTYLYALERCAYPKKEERAKALDFARVVWMDWLGWLAKNSSGLLSRNVNAELGIEAGDADRDRPGSAAARVAERIWAGMVRVTALNDQLDEALSLVRVFVKRFAPGELRTPAPQSPELSVFRPALTVPQADRVLLQVDDTVPPILLFRDVELLHHRLVAVQRWQDVGYLKWAVMAYQGGLGVRRKAGKETEGRKDDGRGLVPTPHVDAAGVGAAGEDQDDDELNIPEHLLSPNTARQGRRAHA